MTLIVVRVCRVEGCDRRWVARGLCRMHYRRWVKWGTTDLVADWRRSRRDNGPRYDFGPVLGQLGRTRTVASMANRLGVHPKQVYRWMSRGLTDMAADRVAARLGMTSYELWPEWARREGSAVICNWVEERRKGTV